MRNHTGFALSLAMVWASLFASPVVAQKIPVEEFSRKPEAWNAALSPGGDYVALAVPTQDGLETQLHIVQLDSGSTQILRFGVRQHISDMVWAADDQLVVARAEMDPLEEAPRSTGELFTTDVKGKNQDMLFGWVPDGILNTGRRKDQGVARIVRVLDEEPGKVLVEFNCWNCGQEPATVIYKVDARTGARQQIERGDRLAEFEFDRTGEPRFRMQLDDEDVPVLAWRRIKGGAWEPVPRSIAGYRFYDIRFEADNNIAYALISDSGEPAQAYRIDVAAGTRTKVAGRDDVAVTRILSTREGGIPVAFYTDADKPLTQYIQADSAWAKLHQSLTDAAPGQVVTLNGESRDGSKVGFVTWSDRSAGSFYVYDRNTKGVRKVVDYMPRLKADELAETRLFSFTNSGGVKLSGLYTARKVARQPMVVVPHGGPFAIYDQWGFNPEVQFLANRGYAVLQINYRGSGGRGKLFEQSGWQGWGTKLQDDIADGVRWAISKNLADPQRICIMGASFGAYSALIQPILHPDLYRCAVGYVGVYDLPLLRKTRTTLGLTDRNERFLDRSMGTDEAMLATISPALRAGEVKVPVLLVHGRADDNTNLNQYKAMEAALKKAGNPPETLLVAGEGHGFVNPGNIAEYYRRVEAFLEKHLLP